MAFHIALFYKYTPIPDPVAFVVTQSTLCSTLGLTGRLLVAAEGINGTLSCEVSSSSPSSNGLQDWIDHMSSLPGFQDVDWKLSDGDIAPFGDTLTVKVVNEIVATGNANANGACDEIANYGGRHLSPQEFHSALTNADSSTVLIDVRNTFEHAIGRFETGSGLSALEPKMRAFTEFDGWCERVAPSLKDKKVLLYCTGGVRCETASCMLTRRGVGDVSQLRGGIHRYMDAFPDGDGLWRGKNFVFDNRVSMSTPPRPQQQEQQQPRIPLQAVGAGDGYVTDVDVVGRCVECHIKYDILSGNRICAVCRDLVLVCPRCATGLREFHCGAHQALKHAFFVFLDGNFTVKQLEEQRTTLVQIVPPRGRRGGGGGVGVGRGKTTDAAGSDQGESNGRKRETDGVAGAGLSFPAAARRDVVRACRKQLVKIDAALERERDRDRARAKQGPNATGGTEDTGNNYPDDSWKMRCRSCGLHETVCSKSRVGTLTRCAANRSRQI